MKIFEIVLKLVFLIGSIVFIITKSVSSNLFFAFLIVCFVLGYVLIANKSPRNISMRRLEGILLILFSIFSFYMSLDIVTLISSL